MTNDIYTTAMQRLARWKTVFASWQLGTRGKNDPECQAVRDHREKTLMLRAEVSALANLLQAKGVFTLDEYMTQCVEEARYLHEHYENVFPGFKATNDGITMDMPAAAETMRGWPK